MRVYKIAFIIFLFFKSSLLATEVKIIELHKNKSLDQLVLDSEINQKINVESVALQEDNTEETVSENISTSGLLNNNNQVPNSEAIVTVLKSDTILDLNEEIIKTHLESIIDIKSYSIRREFIKILSNLNLDNQLQIDNNIYYIIKKLYEAGEIGKAYNLIKSLDKKNISNQSNISYFYLVELNYLFSTFKLSEVCELKSTLLNDSIFIPKFLLEKSNIFCLTLENKFSEAKLLNSLLLDSEKETDKNFQKLFNYMILDNKNEVIFEPLTQIKSKELIFLYSAMLRINELALSEDFIEIDPLNLTIPVILSDSTKMHIRIKAANKAFYDEVLSIQSLSALYQSVDFNSKQFTKPQKTLLSLNNNELIMAFYYQLANTQIFPDQRLSVVLNYWQFAKDSGLEKIAYAITKNIIESFVPTSKNIEFAMDIALAHISNENYTEALNWINLYESSNSSNDKTEFAKFLINLNKTNELDTIINYLSNNYTNLSNSDDQKTQETVEVLIRFLNLEKINEAEISYINIVDNRYMPSYFLIRDIKKNIDSKNDLSFFILSLISLNNKTWIELHPEHLSLLLNAYKSYNQGSLIKPIILEILTELKIF